MPRRRISTAERKAIGRRKRERRARLERMWNRGDDMDAIAAAMGWKPENAQRYIPVYRARGYNLRHRYDEKRVRAQRDGRRS